MKTSLTLIFLVIVLLAVEFIGMPKSYFILQSITYSKIVKTVITSFKQ